MSGSCDPTKTCTEPASVVLTRQIFDAYDARLDVQFRIDVNGDPVPAAQLVLYYFYSSEANEPQVHHATVDPANLDAAGILAEFVEFGPEGSGNWALRVSFAGATVWDKSSGELYLQGRTENFSDYNQGNDFSWPVDVPDFGDLLQRNSRVVLCQLVEQEWQQVWGNAHPDFPDPCATLKE